MLSDSGKAKKVEPIEALQERNRKAVLNRLLMARALVAGTLTVLVSVGPALAATEEVKLTASDGAAGDALGFTS
jgi:hypothetical protein